MKYLSNESHQQCLQPSLLQHLQDRAKFGMAFQLLQPIPQSTQRRPFSHFRRKLASWFTKCSSTIRAASTSSTEWKLRNRHSFWESAGRCIWKPGGVLIRIRSFGCFAKVLWGNEGGWVDFRVAGERERRFGDLFSRWSFNWDLDREHLGTKGRWSQRATQYRAKGSVIGAFEWGVFFLRLKDSRSSSNVPKIFRIFCT